jgi:hypothetical protein
MTAVDIKITGKLVQECLVCVKLNDMRDRLKEMENEIDELIEDFNNTDLDACIRANRYLR